LLPTKTDPYIVTVIAARVSPVVSTRWFTSAGAARLSMMRADGAASELATTEGMTAANTVLASHRL